MKNSKIPTGFEQLDNILNGGFDKTDLIILGARPAMGKTAFALNITQNIAQNSSKAVTIFSLEMSKEKVIQRLILQNKVEKNLNKILNLPIYIDDTTLFKILCNIQADKEDFCNRILELVNLYKVKCKNAIKNYTKTNPSAKLSEYDKDFINWIFDKEQKDV